MKIRQLASTMSFGLGLLAMTAPVLGGQLWSFEDDDIDFILDPVTLIPKTTGQIQLNDIFVSVLEVPEFRIDGVAQLDANLELVGVAAVQWTGVTPGIIPQLIFNPVPGGLDSILALGGGPTVPGGAAGEGAMGSLFVNLAGAAATAADRDLELNRTVNPATNCTSLADCIEQASLGDMFQIDGYLGDPDEFWLSSPIPSISVPDPFNIDQILAANNSQIVSVVNIGLSTFFNSDGDVGFIDVVTGTECNATDYVGDGCVQFSGSSTLTGGQGLENGNGAIAHSDFDAQKYVNVPVPATLALFGAGLIGLGIGSRRRKA